jgi:hypothetical protein
MLETISTTAKDPSSEGMRSRTRKGVPDREEKRCEDSKKMKKPLTPADLLRKFQLGSSAGFESNFMTEAF